MSAGVHGERKGDGLLLLAGGGTGGHLFPALAMAEAWLARHPDNQVLFVGTERGIEARICPREGLPLQTIEVQRLKGGGVKGWAAGLAALPQALWQSRRILREQRPAAVVGVGGYASGPVLLAAALGGWPTVIHEQNAYGGFTNRVLSRFVDKVAVSFAQSGAQFPPRKTVVVGNPVRQVIRDELQAARRRAAQSPRNPDEPPHLLVVGGSQGARGINRALPQTLQELAALGLQPRVRHQTGRLDEADVRREVEQRGLTEQVQLEVFIEDMASAYAWADLVLCRAGATTVFELAAACRPAVLVPFPYAADNHQEANARSLVDAGAGLMIRQAELTPAGLAGTLNELLRSPERLQQMGQAAGAVARPRAAEDVVELVLELVQRRGAAGASGPAAGGAP